MAVGYGLTNRSALPTLALRRSLALARVARLRHRHAGGRRRAGRRDPRRGRRAGRQRRRPRRRARPTGWSRRSGARRRSRGRCTSCSRRCRSTCDSTISRCEALYRVIDHTQADGGAVVLVGDGPPDVVASVEFEIAGDPLADVDGRRPDGAGTVRAPVPDGLPIVAVPFVGDSGPLGAILLVGVNDQRRDGPPARAAGARARLRRQQRARALRGRDPGGHRSRSPAA